MGWATHYIAKLKAGETITFAAPNGNSMRPKIVPGQVVTVAPITAAGVQEGDIVLCKVRGAQYIHIVTAVQGNRCQISNNHGHINGWVGRDCVFGKLVG